MLDGVFRRANQAQNGVPVNRLIEEKFGAASNARPSRARSSSPVIIMIGVDTFKPPGRILRVRSILSGVGMFTSRKTALIFPSPAT